MAIGGKTYARPVASHRCIGRPAWPARPCAGSVPHGGRAAIGAYAARDCGSAAPWWPTSAAVGGGEREVAKRKNLGGQAWETNAPGAAKLEAGAERARTLQRCRLPPLPSSGKGGDRAGLHKGSTKTSGSYGITAGAGCRCYLVLGGKAPGAGSAPATGPHGPPTARAGGGAEARRPWTSCHAGGRAYARPGLA
jgi:hypothetical protein